MGKKHRSRFKQAPAFFFPFLRENISKMGRKVKFAAGEMESFQSRSRPAAPHNWIRGGGERRRWRREFGERGKQNSETRTGPGGLGGRKGCREDEEDEDINMRPYPRVSMRFQLMLHTQGFIIQ